MGHTILIWILDFINIKVIFTFSKFLIPCTLYAYYLQTHIPNSTLAWNLQVVYGTKSKQERCAMAMISSANDMSTNDMSDTLSVMVRIKQQKKLITFSKSKIILWNQTKYWVHEDTSHIKTCRQCTSTTYYLADKCISYRKFK